MRDRSVSSPASYTDGAATQVLNTLTNLHESVTHNAPSFQAARAKLRADTSSLERRAAEREAANAAKLVLRAQEEAAAVRALFGRAVVVCLMCAARRHEPG